jgi:SAM-dependent methyltransferase
MDDYTDKLKRERAWHTESHKPKHLLNARLFYSSKRQDYSYTFARQEMARFVQKTLEEYPPPTSPPSLLIAPIGNGVDLQFVRHITDDITGVDVAQEALDKVPDKSIDLRECDMRQMDCFEDNTFDVVLVPLFFHHFNKMHGDFVKELVRVLKPGGHFISLEPSILHPVSWVTRSLRKVVGNITAQVEDEAPFIPSLLLRAMADNGLEEVGLRAASFSHNRLPVPLARANNLVTRPLMGVPVVKQFAWLCLFYGRKPAQEDTGNNT